jgi:hypothetical protein
VRGDLAGRSSSARSAAAYVRPDETWLAVLTVVGVLLGFALLAIVLTEN